MFCALGLALTGACSTVGTPAVEVPLPQLAAQTCPTQPPTLSDAEIDALVAQFPDATQREREFWIPRDQNHRACELWERARGDAAVSLIARHNQIARDGR